MIREFLFLALIVATISFIFITDAAFAAQAKKPLLQEGKKTLFQKVISHPGAALYSAPDKSSSVVDSQVHTFTVFYVYARKNGWLEVGASSSASQGWLEESDGTDWPQSMTLLFTERTGRLPVLFFASQADLSNLLRTSDLTGQLTKYLDIIEASRKEEITGNIPILAAEPSDKQGAIPRRQFYLMPILGIEEPFEEVKFLRVASIDPGSSVQVESRQTQAVEESMRTGIAFVIDTTISMRPYIEKTLDVVRASFDAIQRKGLEKNVAFAVIAYRNSLKHNPRIEYLTKKVSGFSTLEKRKNLEQALEKVSEATASTHTFNEDAFAGLQAAVEELNWKEYQSKIVVLITDAGPLSTDDPYKTVSMGPVEMADYLREKGIWPIVMHVNSPAGNKNHGYAAGAYRRLTKMDDGSQNYIAIKAPTPEEGAEAFSSAALILANEISTIVSNSQKDQPLEKYDGGKLAGSDGEAKRIATTLGYAMQLEFLGLKKENRAPQVVDAWVVDVDLPQFAAGKKDVTAVQPAVLLTKNQLSDLQHRLQIVVDEAEKAIRLDSKDFFQAIISASAQMTRDPVKFSQNPNQNLVETGTLSEFLNGLPYKSDIMLLTERDWYSMSSGEQKAVVNRLKSRIARYDLYDKDTSNWESFGAKNPGDWVYRVPLTMLP